MDLSEAQWHAIKKFIPDDPIREDGRGRPWKDQRTALNGSLWILRTGAPWKDLPPRYGPYQTAHRRFQNWVRSGVMEKLLLTLAKHLQEAGGLDLKECFVDGTFVPAKKGALGGKNQARPRNQDHGHCRRPWSSSGPADRERFAR